MTHMGLSSPRSDPHTTIWDCPRYARIPTQPRGIVLAALGQRGGLRQRVSMQGFALFHFSLGSLWNASIPRSPNEKCPQGGHRYSLAEREGFEPSVQI